MIRKPAGGRGDGGRPSCPPPQRSEADGGAPGDGRHAVTHWTVLGRYPGYTHVECRLETPVAPIRFGSTWRT